MFKTSETVAANAAANDPNAGTSGGKELSIRDLFLRDLEGGEVDSTSNEDAAPGNAEAGNTAEGDKSAEGAPAATSTESSASAGEPTPAAKAATVDDLESMKQAILSQILDVARAEAEKQADSAQAAGDDVPEFDEEAFIDSFSENPAKAVQELAESIASKKATAQFETLMSELKPLLEQSRAQQYSEKVKSAAQKFLDGHDDAKDLFPDMAEFIRSNNLQPDDDRSYMDAYREAKLKRQAADLEALRSNAGKTLDDYLMEPDSYEKVAANKALMEKLLSDPEVTKSIIEKYVLELDNGGKPVTIGTGGTAKPFAQGRPEYKNVREAGEAFKQSLSR